jgi:hypothetical protein
MRWAVVVVLAGVALSACGGEGADHLVVVGLAVSAEGRRVAVGVPTCGPAEIEVDENDDEVRLTGRGPDDDGDCIEPYFVVVLADPLLDRRLVDTAHPDEPPEVLDCDDPPPVDVRRCEALFG